MGDFARSTFSNYDVSSRVTWHERLPYPKYRELLQTSDIHFYFSRPFVASWSLLEAMSSGCCIVASDISMVKEIGSDSLFYVNHLDHASSAASISQLIRDEPLRRLLSSRARQRSEAYRAQDCLNNLYSHLQPLLVQAS